MELPVILGGAQEKLEKAFMVAVQADWPEGEAFVFAEQAQAIGKAIIPALHDHLKSARIAYLFKEEMQTGDRVKLGVAAKASSKVEYLADYDFLIDFNWSAWRKLTHEQRIALVDHELCHCAFDYEKSRYALRHHDVEEFGEIIRRWGLWQASLTSFGKELADAMGQGDLFHAQVTEAAEKAQQLTLTP